MNEIPKFAQATVNRLSEAFVEGLKEGDESSTVKLVARVVESRGRSLIHEISEKTFPWTDPQKTGSPLLFQIENKSLESSVEIKLQEILDGEEKKYYPAISAMGRSVAGWGDQMFAQVVKANDLSYDGLPLFSGDRPGNANDLTAHPSEMARVELLMESRTGEDGRPLGIVATVAVVPPGLQRDVSEYFTGSVLVNQDLGPDEWYLVDTSEDNLPPAFICQVRQPPHLDFHQQDWSLFVIGRARGNVGATLPQLVTRCRVPR